MAQESSASQFHRKNFDGLQRVSIPDEWFEVYQITANLFAIHEPRHYEETVISLMTDEHVAVLIDTGCGIGNLRKVVEQLTDKPVTVINTHTHLDHVGSNHQFADIAMFDHPSTRSIAQRGIPEHRMRSEILAENLVTPPWPAGFGEGKLPLAPFTVHHWLHDGDRMKLGSFDFEVIFTPGEAADHVCLLERNSRVLFCGDILLEGPVWTHLDDGNLTDLVSSYIRLSNYYDQFDHLMPAHNRPWLDKSLLPRTQQGAERVLAGEAEPQDIVDPWGRQLRLYSFEGFGILTR
jgi:glyoxylase-like metal-dependent hydrolase (beta-lactamase superfamily II)